MKTTTRGHEDHSSLDTAVQSLLDRGFVKASYADNHFRHPERMADGYWQRADAFTPHNMAIGRIHLWPANA